MNAFITIGFKHNGGSEVLATPDVPYDEQKELLKDFASEEFSDVELWSRTMGKIKSRKVKCAVKNTAINKTQKKSTNNVDKKEK